MPLENQQPQTPLTPPVQPPATPPPSPPAQPGEKKRISTAAVNAPEQPDKPPQPRDPAGQYASPKQPPTPPVQPAAPPAPPAPAQPTLPPAAAAPPPAPKHPVWLSELAKTSGFTQEQIDRLDTNALGEGVRFAQARGLNQPQTQQAPPPPPAAPAAPPPPEFDLGLSDDQKEEFGPELMSVLTKIGQAAAQKTAALEQRLAQYEHREVQRSQVQVMNAVDMAITSLPAEYQQILGAGPGVEVMQTMPEVWERRRFVLEALQANGLNYQTASPADIQARIKAKVEAHWGIKAPPPANPPVVTKDQWNGFGSPPPTQRTGPDNLPAREGGKVEDRYHDALTDEETEDERIKASLRRRKQPQPAS